MVTFAAAFPRSHVGADEPGFSLHATEFFPLAADPVQGYAVCRYDLAEGGRFVQRDPASRLRDYRYGANRPTGLTDPSGLWELPRDPNHRRSFAISQSGDTPESLAMRLHLDVKNISKWAKRWTGGDPRAAGADPDQNNEDYSFDVKTEETIFQEGFVLTVPNTILRVLGGTGTPATSRAGSTSQPGIIGGLYAELTNPLNRWSANKNLDEFTGVLRDKGRFHIAPMSEPTRAQLETALGSPDVWGFVYQGHGGGVGLDLQTEGRYKFSVITVGDMKPKLKYGLALVYLFSCDTANSGWRGILSESGHAYGCEQGFVNFDPLDLFNRLLGDYPEEIEKPRQGGK